jgi:choice-of-anchor C domain-containing protein
MSGRAKHEGDWHMKTVVAGFAVCIAVLAAIETRGDNIVVNGDFEQNAAYPGVMSTAGAGDSTSIHGWTVSSGDVDICRDDQFSTHFGSNGAYFIDLDGNQPGGIQQTLSTVPGTDYLLTFDLTGNAGNAPTIKTLTVSAGSSSQDFSYSVSPYTGWASRSWSFTASSTSTILGFASTCDGAFGPEIDNVSVIVVPEPAALVLLAAGVLCLLAYSRQRRTRTG